MSKTYRLSKVNQLIDLNGELINFETTFRAKSKNGEPFELLVIDQATLDNTQNVEFKKIPGEISGTVRQDKNVYQNYSLILRADPPCDCDVEVNTREIPGVAVQPQQAAQAPAPQSKSSKNMWMYVLGGVVALALAWYFLFSGKSKKAVPDLAPSPLPPPVVQGPPPQEQPSGNPFLERLRKLNLNA